MAAGAGPAPGPAGEERPGAASSAVPADSAGASTRPPRFGAAESASSAEHRLRSRGPGREVPWGAAGVEAKDSPGKLLRWRCGAMDDKLGVVTAGDDAH